jgi:pilus assembly protein FimV
MLRASLYLALGSTMLVASGGVQALGFGRVVNVSSLGQPLNFAATVRLDGDESLTIECVSVEVIAGESRLPPGAIRVAVRPGADPSERLIRVSTLNQIEEPIVTVNVTAGCQPQLTRSFVTLIDPPVLNFARTQPDAAPAPSLPPVQPDSPVSPVVAAAQSNQPVPAPVQAAPRPEASARPLPARTAIASVPRQVREVPPDAAPRPRRPATTTPTRAAAVRPEAGSARLRLDAATGVRPASKASAPATVTAAAAPATVAATAAAAAVVASAPVPAPAASAIAAAASAPASAAVAVAAISEAEQKRMAALEESLVRLRESNEATQKALALLQARLQTAETDRFANPLVYGLAGLSALLALLVGFLWWRQSQARGGSQWWIAPAAASGPVPARASAPQRPVKEALSGASKVETEPAVMDDRSGSDSLDEVPPPRIIPPALPNRQVPASMTVAAPAEPPAQRRELSVEELIDLEQQAEFFVVLGQDEAAIDLLMGHVRSSGGVSPLPYLKLLEIYRRRGDREPYERIRERFNQRFNAYAPEWGTDLLLGKALDDYPQMLMKLQRFWDEPARVTELLDGALMRTEGLATESYDLPAYRELLFLYSIARDLAEHPEEAGGAVDLLLPLENESGEEPIEHLSASRLMGFAPTAQFQATKPSPDFDATRPMTDGDAKPSEQLGLINPPLFKRDPNRR